MVDAAHHDLHLAIHVAQHHSLAVHGGRAALALPQLGHEGVRVVGRVEVAAGGAQAEAALREALDARPIS